MTLSVLALTRYNRKGASSRVRFLQYVPHLERLGVAVQVQSLLPDTYLEHLYAVGSRPPGMVATACAQRFLHLLRHHDAPIVWLQREVLPFAPFLLEKALLAGRRVVIDFDDAHHLYYKKISAPWLRAFYVDKIEQLMRHAAVVTVGNHTLLAYAQAAGASQVHLIPSAVDVTRFPKAPTDPTDVAPFTVGWIGTPMTAAEAIPMVRAPLTRFLKETGAQCLLVGVQPEQFPDIPATCVPWSESAEEGYLSQMSVGLCPLQDTPWNRGKSGYKIIQYMSAGKPTLASPVGIAAEITVEGATGFHCRSEDDWYQALMRLYRDPALRVSTGAQAQAIATASYDTAIAAATIARIFESCLRA